MGVFEWGGEEKFSLNLKKKGGGNFWGVKVTRKGGGGGICQLL